VGYNNGPGTRYNPKTDHRRKERGEVGVERQAGWGSRVNRYTYGADIPNPLPVCGKPKKWLCPT
jgi:hypothetical protein